MQAQRSISRFFGTSGVVVTYSILLLTQARAATVVSGYVSGTWTTNQSPYILSADCTVATNQVLTIQPGVEVIVGPDVNLSIDGSLDALGAPSSPISIRGGTPTNYWGSIALYSTGSTNRFHYCHIRDSGYQAILLHVFGRNRSGIAEISNCDFSNCRGAAIAGTVYGVSLQQPEGGDATIRTRVVNCIFESSGDGCLFQGFTAGPNPGNAEINAYVAGNLFRNLSGSALSLYWDFSSGWATNYSRPVFMNNTVVNANRGVTVTYPRFLPMIENNLFVRTSNALFRTSVGQPDFHPSYNCFHGNSANFVHFDGIYGVPVQNNHNGDPCDAFFNIFLDPEFLDTNRFLISSSSPCVNAGDPAIVDSCFEFSHGSAISDIGAYGGPDACGWLTHGFAPVITGMLPDQLSCLGGSARFQVHVEGVEPFSFQWYFNGTNLLAGETNAQLTLVNLQPHQAGLYWVVISNVFGSVTSKPARLLIFDACMGIHLYAGLSVTGMVGRTYAIESTTNLDETNWTLIATNTFTEPRWLYIDTNTPVTPRRFFRVRLEP